MSIPVYPENIMLPSRILPNEAGDFQQLKQQARAGIREAFGIDPVGDEVLRTAQTLDAHQGEEAFELALPWLLEFTFHRVGALATEVKEQLPLWFWDALLMRTITMGRWEGLRYVSEDTFYAGMLMFAKDKAVSDYQLVHYWRRGRQDELASMPDEIIENMYRKHADAK